jgi:hypothetical protein
MRAAITEFNPDGSGKRVFASGLRNPIGLAWNPANNTLWTTVNERDGLGDDLVPDYLTEVKAGAFYGWPFSYIGTQRRSAPQGRAARSRRKAIVPSVLIESHSAPILLAFYNGKMFPQQYRGGIFVALHGSWNRNPRTGYKIIPRAVPERTAVRRLRRLRRRLGSRLRRARGWGRPAGLVVLPDGSLLIADDGADVIWRVTYDGTVVLQWLVAEEPDATTWKWKTDLGREARCSPADACSTIPQQWSGSRFGRRRRPRAGAAPLPHRLPHRAPPGRHSVRRARQCLHAAGHELEGFIPQRRRRSRARSGARPRHRQRMERRGSLHEQIGRSAHRNAPPHPRAGELAPNRSKENSNGRESQHRVEHRQRGHGRLQRLERDRQRHLSDVRPGHEPRRTRTASRRLGITEEMINNLKTQFQNVDIDEYLNTARDYLKSTGNKAGSYAKENPGKVAAGVAALALGAGWSTRP